MLWQRTALDLGRLIRSGEISSVEVADAFLDRIEAANPAINAIVTLAADTVLEAAGAADAALARGEVAGPLHGVPVTVKDLTETKGLRTTYGSHLFADYVPDVDAVLVERLRAAHCPILGKTNTPAFGGSFDTANKVFGATKNPWNLAHSPGGSSGGAAAQLAAGLGPLAQGSDGGGSIRVPAACCGVFGLKPQYGRIPFWPRQDGWIGHIHEGPLARTVRDAAALLDLMAGPDPRDLRCLPAPTGSFLDACDGDVRGLRLAWSPTPGYGAVDSEVQRLCETAAHAFEALGAHVDEIRLDLSEAEAVFLGTLLPRQQVQQERDIPPELAGELESYLSDRYPQRARPSLAALIEAEFGVYRLWDTLAALHQTYDLLLLPTMATAAQRSGRFSPEVVAGTPVEHPLRSLFTFAFNLTGQPAASLPVGFTEAGLPVGLQVVGRRFDEATVLRACARYEAAHPWMDRWPELCDGAM